MSDTQTLTGNINYLGVNPYPCDKKALEFLKSGQVVIPNAPVNQFIRQQGEPTNTGLIWAKEDDDECVTGIYAYCNTCKSWQKKDGILPSEIRHIFRTEPTVKEDMEVKGLNDGWALADGSFGLDLTKSSAFFIKKISDLSSNTICTDVTNCNKACQKCYDFNIPVIGTAGLEVILGNETIISNVADFTELQTEWINYLGFCSDVNILTENGVTNIEILNAPRFPGKIKIGATEYFSVEKDCEVDCPECEEDFEWEIYSILRTDNCETEETP